LHKKNTKKSEKNQKKKKKNQRLGKGQLRKITVSSNPSCGACWEKTWRKKVMGSSKNWIPPIEKVD